MLESSILLQYTRDPQTTLLMRRSYSVNTWKANQNKAKQSREKAQRITYKYNEYITEILIKLLLPVPVKSLW